MIDVEILTDEEITEGLEYWRGQLAERKAEEAERRERVDEMRGAVEALIQADSLDGVRLSELTPLNSDLATVTQLLAQRAAREHLIKRGKIEVNLLEQRLSDAQENTRRAFRQLEDFTGEQFHRERKRAERAEREELSRLTEQARQSVKRAVSHAQV